MFKPLYEYVLIEKDDAPKKTESGLITGVSEDPNEARFGEVVAVGDGYRTDQALSPGVPETVDVFSKLQAFSEAETFQDAEQAMAQMLEPKSQPKPQPKPQPMCLALRVKPGDRVLFRPRSAVTVDHGGSSYYLIKESELMGIDVREGAE